MMQPYSHKNRDNQRQEEGQVIVDAKLAFLDMAPQCKYVLCPDFLSDKVGYNLIRGFPSRVLTNGPLRSSHHLQKEN